jgi:hypothetical protein
MKDLAQTLAAAHVRLAPVDPGPEKRDGSG